MFESSLPDIPRIYTALTEWIACIICVYPIKEEINRGFVIISILTLLGQIALQLLVANWPLMLWIPGMLLNILWMGLTIYLLAELHPSMLFMFLVKAFILSEFLASIVWQIYVTFILDTSLTNNLFVECLNFIGIIALILAIVIFGDHKINYVRLKNAVNRKTVIIFIMTGILIFLASNIGFLLTKTTYHLGNSYSVFFVRTVVNISGICLLYMQQYQLIDQNLRRELDAIQNLFQSQYHQYKAYAENTNYINRKAHDLKHQIQVILAEDDVEVRRRYLSDLSDAIQSLNHKIETGNGVLDTILTRKNMYCQEHDISLTCIANGALLHNMEVMDICSLFGNALDNAIDHVEKIPETEKKLVTLKLQNRGKMVILRVDNYCIDDQLN